MQEHAHRKKGKRGAIIQAAMEVFSRKGYHNARIEEIAVAAGAGKGTVYEYFDSKLTLFQETLDAVWQTYCENTLVDQESVVPFRDQLTRIISAHLRFFKDHHQLARLTFWNVDTVDEELVAWAHQSRIQKENRVLELVQDAMQKGEIKPADPVMVTRMICALIGYFAVQAVLENDGFDPETLAVQITNSLLEGIIKK